MNVTILCFIYYIKPRPFLKRDLNELNYYKEDYYHRNFKVITRLVYDTGSNQIDNGQRLRQCNKLNIFYATVISSSDFHK